jgi:glutathione S-transferase
MPRPDLALLEVGYRKIPLMAIGKDIYSDSRLIISKLESLSKNLLTPAEAGIRKLFENWTIDGGIFANAVKLTPYWHKHGFLQNEAFLNDRQKLMGGRRFTAEGMEAGRPDGSQNMQVALGMLETTFLADGRNWVLGGEEPTVADIDAVWPFEWLIVDSGMTGSLAKEHFGKEKYPKVYAWVERFMKRVEQKKSETAKPISLDGKNMAQWILEASSSPEAVNFIDSNPQNLERGEEVEIFPSDYGQMGKSTGSLIGLTTNEVVIRNSKGLHLHFPLWNFSIKKITPKSTIPATISTTQKLPTMRLIYHPYSPYVRKVFVFAHELGLAKHISLQKVVVCPVPIAGWSDNNADVAVYNPMAKIPCLITEDVPSGIFDSRIVCEYLSTLASVKPRKHAHYWQLRTLHAAADGIMDAVVLITYELHIRKERGLYFDEWVEGQKQKIQRVLDRFEAAAKEGILQYSADEPASVDEIAVAVATTVTQQVGYLDIEWDKGRPKLVEWLGKWGKRPSFVNTPLGKDWVGGPDATSASKI